MIEYQIFSLSDFLSMKSVVNVSINSSIQDLDSYILSLNFSLVLYIDHSLSCDITFIQG